MKKLFSKIIILSICFHLIFPTPSTRAAEGGRSKIPGFYFSFNGDPAPSAVGLNLSANLFRFSRLSFGVGGYSTFLGQAGADISYAGKTVGYAVADLSNIIPSILGYLISGGLIPYSKIRRYFGWNPERAAKRKTIPPASAHTAGGSLKFFVPTWSFSPTLGVGSAIVRSKGGAYDVDGKKTHVYYSGGFDWVSEGGLNLGVGWNHCPSLGKNACGINLTFGAFF